MGEARSTREGGEDGLHIAQAITTAAAAAVCGARVRAFFVSFR